MPYYHDMLNRLCDIIYRLPDTRLLCVGDIMLDCFVRGKVERISPEAPVPILNYIDESTMLGGAGNVIANLRAIGCAATYLGVIGKDAEGEKLQTLMKECGAEHATVAPHGSMTITKARFVAGSNHILRLDKEQSVCLDSRSQKILLAKLEAILPEIDLVLLSDYGKGFLTESFTKQIIRLCRKYKKHVLVDPKGVSYSKYKGVFLIKPNLKELEVVSHTTFDATSPTFIADVSKQALRLAKCLQIEHVVVTLGKKGMLHVQKNARSQQSMYLPAFAKEVFDVSGAGDTSFALLGASLAANAVLADAMHLANIAAGVVVGKLGTATVSKDELLDFCQTQNRDAQFYQTKIVSLDNAVHQVRLHQAKGESVGFTNGCYDMFHLGHLDSFRQAKKVCDFLVVAVNSDSSVRRLKGDSRPIQDERTRSAIVASLTCVDLVIVFDNENAVSLIDALRPDVIAKQGYTIKQWPEAQRVKAYGGKVVTLKELKGYSTSTLIHKLNDLEKNEFGRKNQN